MRMGQFSVTGRLTGPTGLSEEVELFVDTGATLLVIPRSLADRLNVAPRWSQAVLLAGGSTEVWPVGEVRLALEDRKVPLTCFIAPEGPALLGAVPLESLFLAVDPVGRRLVPVKGLVMPAHPRVDLPAAPVLR